jgi:hypothetical protein
MWKNIKNVVSAAADIVSIGTKEVAYQASKASSATETVTGRLATKAATIKAKYEADLADRKSGVVKPEVVKEAEVPTDVVSVN